MTEIAPTRNTLLLCPENHLGLRQILCPTVCLMPWVEMPENMIAVHSGENPARTSAVQDRPQAASYDLPANGGQTKGVSDLYLTYFSIQQTMQVVCAGSTKKCALAV